LLLVLLYSNGVAGTSAASSSVEEAVALDGQFRLLRHDLVGPMREEYQIACTGSSKSSSSSSSVNNNSSNNKIVIRRLAQRTLMNVRAVAVSAEQYGQACVMYQFDQPRQVKSDLPIEAPDQHKKRLATFWLKRKRFLQTGSIVCFVRGERAVRFGIVSRRELSELDIDEPVVGISFTSPTDLVGALAEIGRDGAAEESCRLVQMSASLFAYESVLTRLQKMSAVPFANELLCWHRGAVVEMPTHFDRLSTLVARLEAANDATDVSRVFARNAGAAASQPLILDASQREAILSALRQRVALIQGPPGTGERVGREFCRFCYYDRVNCVKANRSVAH
jgi:hypothetical protein